jgi:hypothetical protein
MVWREFAGDAEGSKHRVAAVGKIRLARHFLDDRAQHEISRIAVNILRAGLASERHLERVGE